MELKIKRLREEAVLPFYATSGAAGMGPHRRLPRRKYHHCADGAGADPYRDCH